MSLPFREIAERLLGNSVPVCDVSWNPPKENVEVAREAIKYLETCSVLFEVNDLKNTENSVNSVMDIRDFLIDCISNVHNKSPLRNLLVGMRVACTKFAEKIHIPGKISIDLSYWWPTVNYFSGIGELRGVLGLYIAQIAVMYGIDVHGSLEAVLPLRYHQDDYKKSFVHFMEKPSIRQQPDGTYSASSHCPCGWSLGGKGKSKTQALVDLWEFYEFHINENDYSLLSPYSRDNRKKYKND